MLPNLIMAEIAVAFFVICVLCVMSEGSPSEKAFSRNLFRRVRITLREINMPIFLIISGIVIFAALKIEALNFKCALLSVGLFAAGLFVLNEFRILCGKKSTRKKKSRKPLEWLLLTKTVPDTKDAPELKEATELAECAELPVLTELTEHTEN